VIARVLNCHPRNVNQNFNRLCWLCPSEQKIICRNGFPGKRRNFSAPASLAFHCPHYGNPGLGKHI